MTFREAQTRLRALGNPDKANFLQGFFRTGPGEYGEGDRFLGLTVPMVRSLIRPFRALPLSEIASLLHSEFHEERLFALLLLVDRFQRAEAKGQKEIYNFYLAHRKHINNWDLVDASAPSIVGQYLFDRSHRVLHSLAKSASMWDRRIAIVSTFYFIRRRELDTTYALAKILLQDPEDLMHKAVGWALRETGKHNPRRLRSFIANHVSKMPRTALRYAIEHFPVSERKRILALPSSYLRTKK